MLRALEAAKEKAEDIASLMGCRLGCLESMREKTTIQASSPAVSLPATCQSRVSLHGTEERAESIEPNVGASNGSRACDENARMQIPSTEQVADKVDWMMLAMAATKSFTVTVDCVFAITPQTSQPVDQKIGH